MLSFRAITKDNFGAIIKMKRPENEHFVASNAYSLAQAWLYKDANDTFPFAIYKDEEPVGFMMLYEECDKRTLGIWRLMFPPEHQGKGYGSWAIGEIIRLARACGKYDRIELDYVPENKIAEHVYKKLGFCPTGEIDDGEIVMNFCLEE